MPLHDKHSIQDNLEDELYSSVDLAAGVAKYKFPSAEQDPRHAYAVSPRRIDAGRQLPSEPGHVLSDLGRARSPSS